MLRLLSAVALAASLTALSGAHLLAEPATDVTPAATAAPAETAPPVEKVTLDVRGLDIDNLLQFYSRTFGLTIIKDPNLTGPVTIMCPRPVSRQEAFATLNSVLGVRGFTAVLSGSVMKIVPVAKAVQSDVGLSVGRSPTEDGDVVITQLIPLKSASAVQLQTDLTPLITTGASLIANGASNTLTVTDYASNIARLLRIIDQLDSANASEVRVFPLTYAQAQDVAQLLTQVFFTQPRTTGTSRAQLPGWQRRLLGAAAAVSGTQGVAAAPMGQVVADDRTNSLLVSTSKERMEGLAQVIRDLDRPVAREGNLTIVALQRANAQDVANALNQALGARTTAQTRAASGATTSRAVTTTTRARTSGGSSGGSAIGRAEPGPEGSTAGSSGAATVIAPGPPAAVVAPSGDAGPGPYEPQPANVLELGGNAAVVAEPNTNSLIITGTPETAALVKQLILELDQSPPQVLIEAIVAEVGLDAERKLGFEWTWTEHSHLGNANLTGTLGTTFGLTTQATGLSYAITGTNLSTLLKALVTDDSVTILSTPRIFTSNNRAAEINISTQTPYVSSVRTTDTSETYAVGYLDVGVILSVTPQIAPDGTVTMQVTQEANELLGFQSFGSSVQAPTVARRSAQATIRVADGQTVILGGIISDSSSRSVSKVPVLGDLPLVGNLFRHSAVTKKKSELLVFLTPRVVRTPQEASALTRSEQAKSIAPMPATPDPGAH
jgi:general secretion pathway protein D